LQTWFDAQAVHAAPWVPQAWADCFVGPRHSLVALQQPEQFDG
jgi:hypothetical protein